MENAHRKHRICISVASDATIRSFLLDQISGLAQKYDVTVMANTDDFSFLNVMQDAGQGRVEGVRNHIQRKISMLHDVGALVHLVRFFRQKRFDVVHSVTPKAGLLSMVAARLAGVPIRVHTFTGQVWATRTGMSRRGLRVLDMVTARAATNILVDSSSQREFLIGQRVVTSHTSRVLAHGSISGVDTIRFRPSMEKRVRIRQQLKILETGIVLLYLGRMNRDKGVIDLAEAFNQLSLQRNDVFLLLVGPDEANIIPQVLEITQATQDRVRCMAYTDAPEDYMAAADVFCLPSYREGFGTVIIEAGAVGIPCVASRIYGVTDAVEENVTGLLHEAGNVSELASRLLQMVVDVEQRQAMGARARRRAIRDFDKAQVTCALLDYYEGLLHGQVAQQVELA
jgi:glycosyltransferase involved in cell wall biosynthesis